MLIPTCSEADPVRFQLAQTLAPGIKESSTFFISFYTSLNKPSVCLFSLYRYVPTFKYYKGKEKDKPKSFAESCKVKVFFQLQQTLHKVPVPVICYKLCQAGSGSVLKKQLDPEPH